MIIIQPDFSNPFYEALVTEQARFAVGPGLALRYPAEVLPFAALRAPSEEALLALHGLLSPDEQVYVTGDRLPRVEGLTRAAPLLAWQMHYPNAAEVPRPEVGKVRALNAAEATRMVALTGIAFPGFFRPNTCVLGQYFGIEEQGKLVAMVGERAALPGFREISALCTHPAFVVRGYAASLLQHILWSHRTAGLGSFLHVTQSNHRAIALYQRLGFVRSRAMTINPVTRA